MTNIVKDVRQLTASKKLICQELVYRPTLQRGMASLALIEGGARDSTDPHIEHSYIG